MNKITKKWWECLNLFWKDLFLINYIFQFRCSKERRAELVKSGVNPFENYRYKRGRGFPRFEPDEDKYFERFSQLELFYAADCSLRDISPLGDIKNIQILDITFNVLRDLSPIHELVQLRELYIQDNTIESLEPVKGAKNLEILFAMNNSINNAATLKNFNKLIIVDLANNGLKDLSSIKDAGSLRELQCGNNKIEQLDFLKNNQTLKILDCSASNIEDMSFLFEIPNLIYANISDNPFEKDKYDWDILRFKGIELILEYDPSNPSLQ